MKKISRIFLVGALTLVLLSAACAGQERSPTAIGTTIPGNETASPGPVATDTIETATLLPEPTLNTTATIDTATISAGTDTTQTPSIPVTGADVVLLECQFCIEGVAHALLVLTDTATYETVADTASLSTPGPGMGCITVDTYHGRQVVICRSQENTSLNLNICTDGNNCTPLLVKLQSCPLTQNGTPGANVTNTPEPGLPKDTPVISATPTP